MHGLTAIVQKKIALVYVTAVSLVLRSVAILGIAGSTAVPENGPRNIMYETIPTITHFRFLEKRL